MFKISAGRAALGVVCAMMLLGAPAGAVDDPLAAPAVVEISDLAFGPKELTIPRGTAVQWINHDDEPHTIVSSDNPKVFRSPTLDTGDKFAFVFKEPGTYRYFCSVHPHMMATIIVK